LITPPKIREIIICETGVLILDYYLYIPGDVKKYILADNSIDK
jgi:hypothetical protein